MTRSKRPPDFEKSLSELEALVERLEGGELPLEESLKAFEAQPFPDEGDDDAGSGEDRLG
jgi:hypothetical protein